VLEIEPRASHMISKCSIIWLTHQVTLIVAQIEYSKKHRHWDE
jgi:hypothetical protein